MTSRRSMHGGKHPDFKGEPINVALHVVAPPNPSGGSSITGGIIHLNDSHKVEVDGVEVSPVNELIWDLPSTTPAPSVPTTKQPRHPYTLHPNIGTFAGGVAKGLLDGFHCTVIGLTQATLPVSQQSLFKPIVSALISTLQAGEGKEHPTTLSFQALRIGSGGEVTDLLTKKSVKEKQVLEELQGQPLLGSLFPNLHVYEVDYTKSCDSILQDIFSHKVDTNVSVFFVLDATTVVKGGGGASGKGKYSKDAAIRKSRLTLGAGSVELTVKLDACFRRRGESKSHSALTLTDAVLEQGFENMRRCSLCFTLSPTKRSCLSFLQDDLPLAQKVGEQLHIVKKAPLSTEFLSHLEEESKSETAGSEEQKHKANNFEKHVRALEDLTARAIEKIEATEQQLQEARRENERIREEKRKLEVDKSDAAVKLTVEKQKAFAQAFKNAFLVRKEQLEKKVEESQMRKELDFWKDKYAKKNVQFDALRGEKDRLQYENIRLNKELKKVTTESGLLNVRLSKMTKELHNAQDEVEKLSSKLSLAKFEATHELHEWESKAVALERDRDRLATALEGKEQELLILKGSLDEEISKVEKLWEDKLQERDSDLQEERQRVSSLRQEQQTLRKKNDELTLDLLHERESLSQATKNSRDEQKKSEKMLEKAKMQVRKAREEFAIEREGYNAMLQEGQTILQELRHVESLLITRPSMYKSGWTGAVAWMQVHGLEPLKSAFEQNGFTDLPSISQIKEEDLLEMKVLKGTRRKILQLVEELRAQLAAHGADEADGTEGKDKRERLSVRIVLNDLYAWMDDLAKSVSTAPEFSDQQEVSPGS